MHLIDRVQADVSLSGGNRAENTWFYVNGMELRVASFNVGSGAFISAQLGVTVIGSGMEYEQHTLLPPREKDRALDRVLEQIAVRHEVRIPTVDSLTFYSLGAEIRDVLGVWYEANPTSSVNRDKGSFPNSSWKFARTPTGNEVRLAGALGASQHLILDAILSVSLGAADTATVNLPSKYLVLYGAEAQCWELLSKNPGQTRTSYLDNAQRAARKYASLLSRFDPRAVGGPARFEDPF